MLCHTPRFRLSYALWGTSKYNTFERQCAYVDVANLNKEALDRNFHAISF